MTADEQVRAALDIVRSLGFERPQQNERTALCLLALLGLRPGQSWDQAGNDLIGITPIMTFAREHYGKEYAPNTRETIRRQSMHQFVDAGVALYNPDKPDRPVNSPAAVYQISPEALALIRTYGTPAWDENLRRHLELNAGLAAKYAKERDLQRIPVTLSNGEVITFSAGEHSELIKAIVEDFGSRFIPRGQLVYAGDTGDKAGYFDVALLKSLGVTVDKRGKMPDAIIYDPKRNWLILAEAVTSHGPVDGKRRDELKKLFAGSTAGLVYVTAFPDRKVMAAYLPAIAWETEVWVADAPTHMIHLNGVRFLGPYDE